MRSLSFIAVAVVATVLIFAPAVYAYEVPRQNTQIKHFYVFGPDGDPLMGKEDSKLELFIDVPAASSGQVVIDVFDPDTTGKNDWRTDVNLNPFDTVTRFTVSGSSELDRETFTDGRYDNDYFRFGPYDKTQGQKVGDVYRFRLLVEGIEGDDQNLFKVAIAPEDSESFVYNMTFRLVTDQGDKMYFYPEIPAGTSSLVVENYDLDRTGGHSALLEGANRLRHDINDSTSGQWSQTNVNLASQHSGRLIYVITKETQRNANAGVRIEDASGSPVPIYFRRGKPIVIANAPAPAQKAPVGKCNTFTFDARKSYDSDHEKITYEWDFGDGGSSIEAYTTHTYADAGDYIVTLTVVDNSGLECDTAVTTSSVTVNTPPQAVFSAPDQVCVDDTVTLDASASTDNTPNALTYSWNLGDGSRAEGSSVSKVYGKGGVYKVQLSVNDNSGTACNTDGTSRTIRVNTPPEASAGKDIAICQKSGGDGFQVRFDGAGSSDPDGDPLSYFWDFGDGESSEGRSISHVYQEPGDYVAKLMVRDSTESACSAAVDSINVSLNRAPVADAGADVSTCLGNSISFDASRSSAGGSAPLTYTWDFGDGNTATGQAVDYTYDAGGRYKVTLTVDDGKGTTCSKASDSLSVSINSAPTVSVADVETICLGNAVSFRANVEDADGDNVKLVWDFGDGDVVSGGSSITHKYAKGGFYPVKVTADDGKSSACSEAVDTTYVEINTPPVADAGENQACCTDQEVAFDAGGSSDAEAESISYKWNFGDGNTGEGAQVKHTYTKNGVYKVVLTVDDGSDTPCSDDTDGFSAKVNAKPVPVIEIS